MVFAVLIMFALVALPELRAQSTFVPISNLNQPLGSGHYAYVSSNQMEAMSFTTGNTPTALSSVSISMNDGQAGLSGSLGTFALALYSDSPGSPGNCLMILSGTNSPAVAGIYTYTNPFALVLAANTTYWIVGSSSNSTGTSGYKWVLTSYATLDSGSIWTLGVDEERDGSNSWETNSGYYLEFSVAVTTNLPATPMISSLPTASSISHGQTLASSTLTGGAATNTAGAPVPGTFAFTAPSTMPGIGTNLQSVTFTPTDAVDYTTATASVRVPVIPSSTSAQYFTNTPIFQFDIFYNLNLEFTLSGSYQNNINGPVFSNAGIWVGTPMVNFTSSVSACNQVSTNNTVDPFDAGEPTYGPVAKNCFLPGQPVTGISPLSLPVFGTTNVKAMLNLPPSGLGAPNAAAYAPSNQVYLYNAVDLIISNAAASMTNSSMTNITVFYQNPYILPALTPLPPDQTNFVAGVAVGKFYSFVTNVTFYDFRETATNHAVQLDLARFKIWLTNTNATGGNSWNAGNLATKGHGINSIYLYNSVPLTGTQLPAVRLVNGQQMPSAYGLTIATPQPVYVLGNYNVQTNDSGVPNSLGVSNTACTYPAAIMADAVTVLSSNWSDAYISTTVSSRPATNTTINAAVLAGIVPSNPTNETYSGGVDNFLRLEENWSISGVTLTHNGSIAAMFISQYATNPWNLSGVFYTPPVRHWSFDTNFLNPARLPPLTPLLLANTSSPAITLPPQGQSIASGNNAFFSVQASGALPFTYSWSFNGTAISGATNTSFALTNVQDAQSGGYAVQVSNAFGSTNSAQVFLTVLHVAPVIFTNPASQTLNVHSNAAFSFYSWGSLPMQFQWFGNGEAIAGATNVQLTLTNVQATQAGNYFVLVSNVYGSATSAPATLTVIAVPPSISSQPVSQSVFQGSTVNFAAVAGGTSPFNYQWNFNGTSLLNATNSVLTLPDVQVGQAGSYFVMVTNSYGSTNSVVVTLNVSTNLLLLLPVTVNEGDGVLTNAGCASLSAPSTAGLVVSLVSSDPTRLAVPSTVTIPAGQTNGFFNLTIIDNNLSNGTDSVTVVASAAGCSDATEPVNILDNDENHFTFSAISSPQIAGAPLDVAVGAVDDTGASSPDFHGVVTLSASGDSGNLTVSPASISNFVSGQWLGSVVITPASSNIILTASDGSGHSGSSNPFDVIVAGLDHFAWSPVAAIQTSTVPFGVTITAEDKFNHALTTFTNPVALSAFTSVTNVTVGSNLGSGGSLLAAQFPVSRSQIIYLASDLNGAAAITALAIKVDGLPGQTLNNWTIRMKPTWLASYSTNSWEASGWTTVYQNNESFTNLGWIKFSFLRPFFYDGTNNLMVDFSFSNSSGTADGSSRVTTTSASRTLYRSDSLEDGDPLTWSGFTPTCYPLNLISDVQFMTAGALVSITPTNSDNFVNGTWTGSITAWPSATEVILQADDGGGHVGFSDPFQSVSLSPVILSQPADEIVVTGSSAMFSIKAGGTPPLYYQWQMDGTNLIDATNATLALNNITVDQTGAYSVTVTNGSGGVVSSNAWLSVYPSSVPTIGTAAFSAEGSFQFEVTGVPGFGYIVAVSTNLVDWAPLCTNASPFNFTDTNVQAQQRFYRVISAQ